MPTLTYESGPKAGRRILIERDHGCVVGRTQGDVTLDDSEVSRRHAAFRLENGRLVVEDLDSLNGTWVNEERITARRILGTGDKVRIGTTLFSVEAEPVETPTAVASAAVAAPAPLAKAQAQPPLAANIAEPSPEPFDSRDEGPAAPRGKIASRRFGPLIFSVTVTVATAIALVIYFATR